jgi:hypothetical protein
MTIKAKNAAFKSWSGFPSDWPSPVVFAAQAL